MTNKEIQRRAVFLLTVAAVGVLGLVGQLGHLQLLNRPRYAQSAERQQTQYLGAPAPRGLILDRNGVALATNRPANVVVVRYPHYKDGSVRARLARILDMPLERLQKKAEYKLRQDGRLWDPLLIKGDLTREQYAALVEYRDELPGVDVVVHPVREYPQGSLAGHALGYVGTISEEELAQLQEKGYRGGDTVGKSGVEKYYEPYLRGTEGIRQVRVDFSFTPQGDPGWVREPVPGRNLVLTLDARLQRAAERALDWQMLRLQNLPHPADRRTYPGARAGAAVVLDVKTGAILAMASRPAFDPNLFVTGSDGDLAALWKSDPPALWNRAITAEYAPGSTWKMMTGAAALAAGKVGPSETVFCRGKDPDTGQLCWQKWGHGAVDAATALRDSCDVYYYEMGKRLGIGALVQWARSFGFGQPTGVDLPEESPGFLPGEAYRDKHGWWLGDTLSAAIGQIFQVTPLQLARYTAAIASGGRIMRPYLVARITDQSGQVVQEFPPQELGRVPVPPAVFAQISRGMLLVNAPGGTADFAIFPLPGIATAGKTGTAENPPRDDYGVYVAYAPVQDPQIAVAVLIEQAGHGASVSPVARTIMAEYFNVRLPSGDPARVPEEFPERTAEILRTLQTGGTWAGRGDR